MTILRAPFAVHHGGQTGDEAAFTVSEAGALSSRAQTITLDDKGGGQYGESVQTILPAVRANVTTRSQGQAIGLYAPMRVLGKGNGLFGCSFVEFYGGGDVSESDAIPELSPVGEFQAVSGLKVFRASVVSDIAAGQRTVAYTDAEDEDCLGCRLILNKTKSYTEGHATSIDGTYDRIVFTGAHFDGPPFTEHAVDSGYWWLKIGSSDEGYEGAAVGDDVNPSDIGFGLGGTDINVGHWYRVVGVEDDTLILECLYDPYGLTQPGEGVDYMLCEGVVPNETDTTQKTITLPIGHPLQWEAEDELVSPPNHLVAWCGINIIFNKLHKRVGGFGIKMVNWGPQQIEYAALFSGNSNDDSGGFRNGIVFDDMELPGYILDTSRVDSGGVIERSSADGVKNVHYFGTGGECSLFHDARPASDTAGALVVGAGAVGDDNGYLAFDRGIMPGPGLMHGTASTGDIGEGATATVPVEYPTSLVDDNYSFTCSLEDSSGFLRLLCVTARDEDGFSVSVQNTDAEAHHTGTLHYQAIRHLIPPT